MQALRRLLQLSRREIWLLIQAAILLSAVRVALNFTAVARLQLIRPKARGKSDVSPRVVASMVRIAAQRGFYRAKCLEQSLVLRWLLQRRGIDARILFGARKEAEQMQAHAWVEVDSVALNEDDGAHQDFSRFEELASSNPDKPARVAGASAP